ncbi:MAG: glycosyltransferase family 4 protein [Phycisphaerales bacterium]
MITTHPLNTDESAAQRSDPASIAPGLAGRHVLVDTYNIRLHQGSGIKTYGITLLEALHALDADISLLGDRQVARTRDRALAEVLFYDHVRHRSRLARTLSSVHRGLATLFGAVAPVEIAERHVLPDRALRPVPGPRRVFNISRIYDSANVMYRRVGRFTRIKLTKTPDIWHATTLLPIEVRGARMVTTIHDLIPLRLPYTTLDDKKSFFNLAKDAIERSKMVLTVSECTKRDIVKFFNTDPQRIAVTYQSVAFKPYVADEGVERVVMKRYGLEPGRYLLFVGTIEPKKNVAAIIRAAAMLDDDLTLVVAGRKGWLWEDELEPAEHLFRKKQSKRFKLLDYVPEMDLPALYANAFCLVFPSLYEGFGLPPLEAMAHGCPVIASNTSSLPEVCGDAALLIDPHEPATIRTAIERLRDEPRLRKTLIDRGYQRVEFFSPRNYAERLRSAYQRVLTS